MNAAVVLFPVLGDYLRCLIVFNTIPTSVHLFVRNIYCWPIEMKEFATARDTLHLKSAQSLSRRVITLIRESWLRKLKTSRGKKKKLEEGQRKVEDKNTMLLNKIEELARQNTQLMQKEKNIREINDELKEENIRLHKKIQGKTSMPTKGLGKIIDFTSLKSHCT
ncbi:uncharacterized protein LOC144643888 [Oculina patagonica]